MALKCIHKPRHPVFVPELKIFKNQIIFAWEVPIESNFGDAGFRDDMVDSCCPDAFAVKQIMRGEQDTFSCGHIVAVIFFD